MTIYPFLDDAFTAARREMEEAVDDEVTSRFSSLLSELTVVKGSAVFRAWNEDEDEVIFTIDDLAIKTISGIAAATRAGDEWVLEEGIAVSSALRNAADLIDAELKKR